MSKLGTLATWRGANTGTYINDPPPTAAASFSTGQFCKVSIQALTTIALNAVVPFDTVQADTALFWQGGGVMKVPSTGIYQIAVRLTRLTPAGGPNSDFDYFVQVDGVPIAHANSGINTPTSSNTLTIDTLFIANSNQLVRVVNGAFHTLGTTGLLYDYEFSMIKVG